MHYLSRKVIAAPIWKPAPFMRQHKFLTLKAELPISQIARRVVGRLLPSEVACTDAKARCPSWWCVCNSQSIGGDWGRNWCCLDLSGQQFQSSMLEQLGRCRPVKNLPLEIYRLLPLGVVGQIPKPSEIAVRLTRGRS
jgi:hypothetical protein